MLTGELIQRIQSLYSKGVQSDDTRLSSRHIYSKLLTVRARLISQELKKKQKISQWNYQTISCIELQSVPSHQCPCLPPIGCEILRSKYKLPKPITGLSGTLIQSVQTIDRSLKIDEISLNALNSQKGNKYTPKKINYFIQDGYLYLSTYTKIEIITLIGLFEDPIEVATFIGLCQLECTDCIGCIDPFEQEFPLSKDMADALIELSVIELIQMFNQNREDSKNDTRDVNRDTNREQPR